MKIKQLKNGEAFWINQKRGKLLYDQIICCDCNLVHDEYYEIKNGKIRVTVFRNDFETDRLRSKRRKARMPKHPSKKKSKKRRKTNG